MKSPSIHCLWVLLSAYNSSFLGADSSGVKLNKKKETAAIYKAIVRKVSSGCPVCVCKLLTTFGPSVVLSRVDASKVHKDKYFFRVLWLNPHPL